jgi:hypothetical protein
VRFSTAFGSPVHGLPSSYTQPPRCGIRTADSHQCALAARGQKVALAQYCDLAMLQLPRIFQTPVRLWNRAKRRCVPGSSAQPLSDFCRRVSFFVSKWSGNGSIAIGAAICFRSEGERSTPCTRRGAETARPLPSSYDGAFCLSVGGGTVQALNVPVGGGCPAASRCYYGVTTMKKGLRHFVLSPSRIWYARRDSNPGPAD